jgi:hypothetical protein
MRFFDQHFYLDLDEPLIATIEQVRSMSMTQPMWSLLVYLELAI